MAGILSLEQMTELKDTFALFDKDGDGTITAEDLHEVFQAVGQNVGKQDIDGILESVDLNANGVIDFPEFLTIVSKRMSDVVETENDLLGTFKVYDLNNTGFITAANLQHCMKKMGCPLTPEEAQEMVAEADTDGDGVLNFTDFKRVMLSTLGT